MRKLKLDVETLAVETFAAAASEPARGTVGGHAKLTDGCPMSAGNSCVSTCWRDCDLTVDSCYITQCYDVCQASQQRVC